MTIFGIEAFKVFLLVMFRISGMMVSAPILGSGNFPTIAKIGFTGLFAMLMTPEVTMAQGATLPSSALGLAVMGVGEMVIGLLIGFTMTLVFAAVQVGGQIMDLQTGFGMMNVFNPAFESQFPIYGFFYFIIAVLYLLIINGHHLMIRAMASTFDKIPLGGFVFNPGLLREISTWGSAMYLDGLLIAAPVAGAMFLTYASLGLLGRVVPQIHLFVVGFPLTIALGLFIVGLSLTFYLDVLNGMFDRMFNNVDTAIRGMM